MRKGEGIAEPDIRRNAHRARFAASGMRVTVEGRRHEKAERQMDGCKRL